MSTILTNGLKLPDKGSVDWYADMQNNYSILDGAVGTVAEHTTALAGKAPAVHTHTKSDVTDLFNSANTWSANNTYSANCIIYNSDNSGSVATLKLRNSKAEVLSTGNTSSDQSMTFRDKNDIAISYIKGAVQSSGVALKIGAYAKDSNNNTVNTELQLLAYSNGNKAIFPSTTNAYDLGGSSYQWNNVYSKGYYYNGVAWGLDKANVWTQDQTYSTPIYGQMIWLKNTDLDFSVNGNTGLSNTYQHMIHWVDKNNVVYSSIQSWTASSENTLVLRSKYRTDASTVRDLSVRFTSTATNKVIYPETNGDVDLGTSTNKWKTLNGVNPGALSLPGEYGSSVTEYITDKTGGNNAYTAPADGWVGIQASSVTLDPANFIFMGRTSDGSNYYAQNASSPINGYWSNSYHGCIILPVIGGKTYGIRCKCDSVDAKFYKANGNVS